MTTCNDLSRCYLLATSVKLTITSSTQRGAFNTLSQISQLIYCCYSPNCCLLLSQRLQHCTINPNEHAVRYRALTVFTHCVCAPTTVDRSCCSSCSKAVPRLEGTQPFLQGSQSCHYSCYHI